MKIICESLDEYDQLMRASKYLHDFSVSVDDFLDEDEAVLAICLNQNDPIVSLLTGLYLTESDFPNKRDVVEVRISDEKETFCRKQ